MRNIDNKIDFPQEMKVSNPKKKGFRASLKAKSLVARVEQLGPLSFPCIYQYRVPVAPVQRVQNEEVNRRKCL